MPPNEEENYDCHINIVPGWARGVGERSRQFRHLIEIKDTSGHLRASISAHVEMNYLDQEDQEPCDSSRLIVIQMKSCLREQFADSGE
jgi:hypothetical protein